MNYIGQIFLLMNIVCVTDHEKKFIQFFSARENFPESSGDFQIIQTHISIVLLAPPFAYKAKKDIRLSFLDFSNSSKRLFYLKKELHLNQRLCHEIYQDIMPVYMDHEELTFNPKGSPYDHILKMKYIPKENLLPEILKNGKFHTREAKRLADHLHSFYSHLPPVPVKKKSPLKFLKPITKNIEELQGLSAPESMAAVKALRFYTRNYIRTFEKELIKRTEHVKDCHGDLRLEHIAIDKRNVCIFDCIEFNETFRKIDELCDIAFLAMELDFYGYSKKGKLIVDKLSSQCGISVCAHLLLFYKIYRALVRAKVNLILASENEVPLADREKAIDLSKRFISISINYAITAELPLIIVIMGKTASGKSAVSRQLSIDLESPVISSDVIRKTMAGVDLYSETLPEMKQRIYASDYSVKVYERIEAEVKINLSRGNVAIVDGTFSRQKYRSSFIKRFRKYRILFVELSVPDSIAKTRLQNRQKEKCI